jgi:hypothetical protein
MKANLFFLVGRVSSDPKVARPRKTNPRKVGTHKEPHARVLNKLENFKFFIIKLHIM